MVAGPLSGTSLSVGAEPLSGIELISNPPCSHKKSRLLRGGFGKNEFRLQLETQGHSSKWTLKSYVLLVDGFKSSIVVRFKAAHGTIMQVEPVLELVAHFEPQVPGVVTEADLGIDNIRYKPIGPPPPLAPIEREEILGYARIKEVFSITKIGKVAGCAVTEGVVRRGARDVSHGKGRGGEVEQRDEADGRKEEEREPAVDEPLLTPRA